MSGTKDPVETACSEQMIVAARPSVGKTMLRKVPDPFPPENIPAFHKWDMPSMAPNHGVADVYAIAHAYTANMTGGYNGGCEHIVTRDAIKLGRSLYRDPGDALCKPRRKFWGLELSGAVGGALPLEKVTCKRCREIAEREGLISASKAGGAR